MPTDAAPERHPEPHDERHDERPDDRLKKLIFRASRRGFLEADLILGPFAVRHVHALSPDELDGFEQLLDQPDHDLYAWIVGAAPTPAEFDTPLMARLREFRLVVHAVCADARASIGAL